MGVKLKEAMGDGMRVDKWCLLFHPLRMVLHICSISLAYGFSWADA